MSDSEKDTKADVSNPASRPHYDPVPTPRALLKEDKAAVGVEQNNEEPEPEGQKDIEKPLLEEDSVTIEITRPRNVAQDTTTIRDTKKNSITDSEDGVGKQKAKLPVYLFPCTRIKEAWLDSSNICSFIGTAVCIIFQTVGWFTCVGGIPFVSLVMLVIGSVYIDECNIEPNIPIYLIVSGVIGTIQHVITIWTKYVPKESKGRLKVKRSYCSSLNGLFHIFLMIWFILGCVWVYSAHAEVDFKDTHKEEYCHKTLYYFAFWILNLSFILLGLIVVLSICFLFCVVATPKDEEKGVIQ